MPGSQKRLITEIGILYTIPIEATMNSSSQTPPGAQKTVSFSLHVKARHTLHMNDYTDDEYAACWFGPEEMNKIMDDIFCTLDLIENMLQVDDEKHCRRGLERHTSIGSELVMHNRKKARATVLLDGQQYGGVRDHDKVAKAYQECTQSSTNLAYVIGVSDAKIVFSFLKKSTNIDTRSEHHRIHPKHKIAIDYHGSFMHLPHRKQHHHRCST
jgi:hypothetical protein